ncbi:putative acetyltransferase [Paracoccus isoporae]|uniref:Putative acetyltransferase n=1 Tax=Paracoccus isoporae TaxID=591205 RepID=A0A1G6WBD8_9RHOB|nr:GNAT family N-acetyltransferase [Paracoccus isoporae]SDD62993.1 putative acetyltransferase [Paracoccus isoporae]
MDALTIGPADPLDTRLDLLFARHTEFCHADTPPESIHMMDRAALRAPGITFLAAFAGLRAIGMGAVKDLGAGLAELKSMHVLQEARGGGAARQLLAALIDTARQMGAATLALETGAQPSFAPARAFYRRNGFCDCPPFGSYGHDPMSAFMRRDLSGA